MDRHTQSYIRNILDHDHKDLFMECLRLHELLSEKQEEDYDVYEYPHSITIEEIADKNHRFDPISHDVWLESVRSKIGDRSILGILSPLPTELGLYKFDMVRRVAGKIGENDVIQPCFVKVWVVPVED